MTIATLTKLTTLTDPTVRFRDVHTGLERTYVGPKHRALASRLRPGEEMLAEVSGREWQAAGKQ